MIHTALAERRTLRTRYYSASRDREDVREIDPYHLTLHNGGLYLIGHCHPRDDVRIFAVERMRRPLHRARGVRAGGWCLPSASGCGPVAEAAPPAGRTGGDDAAPGGHAGGAVVDL